MAASLSCSRTSFPAVSNIFSTRNHVRISILPSNRTIVRLNFSKSNHNFKISRVNLFHGTRKASNYGSRMFVISCLVDDNAEVHQESEPSSNSNDSPLEMGINLKLPRRSLLVQFTCNACGTRSQRLVNRLAFERGTVFVQCSGCSQHHKLVDNLGLVIEYDLREDVSLDPSADRD